MESISSQTLDCYVLAAKPFPLLLPTDCIADILVEAEVEPLSDSRTSWMCGHVVWQSQRLPVLSYPALHGLDISESEPSVQRIAVLNPIADAARKAFTALVIAGEAAQIKIDDSAVYEDLPAELDGRYVQATIKFQGQVYVIPRLSALGVAFSYF